MLLLLVVLLNQALTPVFITQKLISQLQLFARFQGRASSWPPQQNTHLAEDNTHLADENCVDVQSDDNEYSDNERGNDIGEKLREDLHLCFFACKQSCMYPSLLHRK